MKLKIYSTENCEGLRIGKPTIRINAKNGFISFSKAACDILEIKHGDYVIFNQDEERPKDWYISKTKGETGFKVRSKNVSGKCLGSDAKFNCSALTKAITKSLKIEGLSIGFMIACEPVENIEPKMFAILTSKPF
jgi:hypothetical protein